MTWPLVRSAFLSLAAIASMAAAPVRGYGPDPHIQSIYFNPDTVIPITGAVGWQIMIEFGADERIENVSIGESAAWQVTPNKRARMLFIKPLHRRASTNMTVVTTLRQYVFNLSVGPRTARMPWIVRFNYPPPPPELVEAVPPPPPVKLDFGYAITGDKGLLPDRVWDDGRQTYFEFSDDIGMPAIFAEGGKDESLVNVSVRGRVAVVQQRAARFTLRAGKKIGIVTKTQAQVASSFPPGQP